VGRRRLGGDIGLGMSGGEQCRSEKSLHKVSDLNGGGKEERCLRIQEK